MTNEEMKQLNRRLVETRAKILQQYPFYGHLLMHLKLGAAECGTAYTDMTSIVFDPAFVCRLDETELIFLMLHEVCHCAHKHCVRGRNRNPQLFNIACDICVNDLLLLTMGLPDTFTVDGEVPMHVAPDGKGGHFYSAEEVYDQLMQQALQGNAPGAGSGAGSNPGGAGSGYAPGGGTLDDHSHWDDIADPAQVLHIWDRNVEEAAEIMGSSGQGSEVDPHLRQEIRRLNREHQVNWREVLHEFLHIVQDSFDYTFQPPDRRFSYQELILPAFHELDSLTVGKLWFVADASGSVSDEALRVVYEEICGALEDFPRMEGMISFFDTGITEPEEFGDADELLEIRPVGGGGTDFSVPFRYLREEMDPRDQPEAIIFLTDGFGCYPPEEAAEEIPVLWIIMNGGPEPDWGTVTGIRV